MSDHSPSIPPSPLPAGPSPAKRVKVADAVEQFPSNTSHPDDGNPTASSSKPLGVDDVPGMSHVGEPSSNGADGMKLDGPHSNSLGRSNGADSQGASYPSGEASGSKDKVDEVESSDEEEEPEEHELEEEVEDLSRRDMYLDTIARANLDFDFERLCSKSLSNINIYCCLVCGKYFQGRGRGSWAYRHAVDQNHRVWVNLATEKFYVLPEGYLVSDPSLQDIIAVLHPRYQPESLPKLSLLPPKPSFTLAGSTYLPGYIGLNNIKANDYMNVIVHLILHVKPIRSFLLDPNTPQLQETARPPPTELVKRLTQLAKTVWNPRLFKNQASPHEFLQEVGRRSEGRYKITEQGDPVNFLGWLLNTLHRDLGGGKKPNSSIIYKTFQGEVRIQTQEVIVNKSAARPAFDISRDIKTIKSPFLFLALDLPPPPLFQDLNEKRIIPQIPLSAILAKFDGVTTQESGSTLKRHHLTRLPPYLILHIKRFTKNNFVEEKNPTIVNFPLRGVDLTPYVDPKPSPPLSSLFDLIANIPLDSTVASTSSSGTGPGVSKRNEKEEAETSWKVHLRAGSGGGDAEKWFAIQDLRVEDVRPEMVFLGETVVQVWERRS